MTALLLLQWYKGREGLQCEIDAYGDFLQALGPEGTIEYCKNVKVSTFLSRTKLTFPEYRGGDLIKLNI